jgi:hypothetical protein
MVDLRKHDQEYERKVDQSYPDKHAPGYLLDRSEPVAYARGQKKHERCRECSDAHIVSDVVCGLMHAFLIPVSASLTVRRNVSAYQMTANGNNALRRLAFNIEIRN